MESTEITPADVVAAVKASGGWSGRLATRFDLKKTTVQSWKETGRVPKWWAKLIGPSVQREVSKIVTS